MYRIEGITPISTSYMNQTNAKRSDKLTTKHLINIRSLRAELADSKQPKWNNLTSEQSSLTVLFGSYDENVAATMSWNSADPFSPTSTTCFLDGTESISAAQHIKGNAILSCRSLVSKTACEVTIANNKHKQISCSKIYCLKHDCLYVEAFWSTWWS
jgi:hypothetical protein